MAFQGRIMGCSKKIKTERMQMLGTLLSWIVRHLLSTHTATTSLFLDKALCAWTLKKKTQIAIAIRLTILQLSSRQPVACLHVACSTAAESRQWTASALGKISGTIDLKQTVRCERRRRLSAGYKYIYHIYCIYFTE